MILSTAISLWGPTQLLGTIHTKKRKHLLILLKKFNIF
jgi:hypothetical protein